MSVLSTPSGEKKESKDEGRGEGNEKECEYIYRLSSSYNINATTELGQGRVGWKEGQKERREDR